MLTLRNRLLLVNALVFVLTFAVLAGVLSGQLVSHLYEQLDLELARAANLALAQVSVTDDRPQPLGGDGRLGAGEGSGGWVRLFDSQGAPIDSADDFEGAPLGAKALAAPEDGVARTQRRGDGEALRVYTRPIYAPSAQQGRIKVGYIQTASVPEEVQEIVGQIRKSLLIAMPVALLIASLAGFLAIRKALEPLTVMTQSAAAISADSLAQQRLPIPQTRDEVQTLALTFNATLERLSHRLCRASVA